MRHFLLYVLLLCHVADVVTARDCTLPDGLINMSTGMVTEQSSVKGSGRSEKAVDDNRNSVFNQKSCTMTLKEFQPWWRVDLGATRSVYKVTITNRQDCCATRLKKAEIHIGDSENFDENPRCGKRVSRKMSENETIDIACKCGKPMTGRYVSIRLQNMTQALTLCEVDVWALEEVIHLPEICIVPDDLISVSTGMMANQSSTKGRFGAEKAVDDNRNSSFAMKSCTKTIKEFQPWWSVDLMESREIYKVVITNRQDCCAAKLKNAEVRVGDSINFDDNALCGTRVSRKVALQETIEFVCACDEPLVGRYVIIRLQESTQILTLCEVDVMTLPIPPTRPPFLANIAYRKPTYQSSTIWHANSTRAVDGDIDGVFCHGSCTLTKTQFNPWWIVDLMIPRLIFDIAIHNREDCCDTRLIGATVRAGNSGVNFLDNPVCAVITEEMITNGPMIPVDCDSLGSDFKARYVSIDRDGTRTALSLCEVEVYSYFESIDTLEEQPNPPVCQVPEDLINIAFKMQTSQISKKGGAKSLRAVDGVKTIDLSVGKSCSQTQLEVEPWWRVDLGESYDVYRVDITNRLDSDAESLINAEVRVGNSEIMYENSVCGDMIPEDVVYDNPIGVICACGLPLSGQYVTIQLVGMTEILTLCEVEVMVPLTLDPSDCPIAPGVMNIATHMPVAQSSMKRGGRAERAVDGDKNAIYTGGSCTMTAKEYEPWWYVDLTESRDVYGVTITNREDCCAGRLKNAEIRVGDSLDFTTNTQCGIKRISGKETRVPTVRQACSCGLPVTGRYVSIQIMEREQTLSLCEVEVWSVERVTAIPPITFTFGPLYTTVEPCAVPEGLTNIATGHMVIQSSTQRNGVAERAIDGNTNNDFAGGSCTMTSKEFQPWWKIDLGVSREIYHVTIANRMDCCNFRVRKSEVRVGDNEDFTQNALCGPRPITGRMARNETINVVCGCGEPITGRYVSIQIFNKTQILTLCEVEIYAFSGTGNLTLSEQWTTVPMTSLPFTTGPGFTTLIPCIEPVGLLNTTKGVGAIQSSTRRGAKAGRAVDSGYSSDFADLTCTHTAKEWEPWWMVDLGGPLEVYKVSITNRMDCCSFRLRGSEIRVGNSLSIAENTMCGKRPLSRRSTRAETIDQVCNCTGIPIEGRYVSVQIKGARQVLNLCEVDIWMLEPGHYTEKVCTIPNDVQNVALGKLVQQSSIKNGGEPERAVDGNKNSNFDGNSCSLTKRENEPWWVVDLGESRDVYQVVITNRMDCCSFKLANVEVHVGDSEVMDENPICGTRMSKDEVLFETINIPCGCSEYITGRYVSLQLKDVVKELCLCEVEIFATP